MMVEIREFRAGDQTAFRELNEAWIAAYFQIEEKDREILNDPQRYILDSGGRIYFAVDSMTEEILGCCALVAMGDGVFEVAKMAVAENSRRQALGGSCCAASSRQLVHSVQHVFTSKPTTR